MGKVLLLLAALLSTCNFQISGQNIKWEKCDVSIPYIQPVTSVTAKDSLVLIVANSELCISTNSGETWQSTEYKFNSTQIVNENLILGRMDYDYPYISTDGGFTWLQMTDLPSKSSNLIYAANGYMYLGGLEGIYRSTDSGNTWAIMNNGLQQTSTSVSTI